jgi:hypothetical protein
MSFTYIPIPLFNEETFKLCIVVPFPEGGTIVDTALIDKTAYIIVEAHPSAKATSAHFHIVPMLQKLYADGHKYIGTFKIEDFQDQPLAAFTVIQITSGDYGINSQEFIDTFGTEERDRIIAMYNPDALDIPAPTDNDNQLRKLWDFSIGYDGGPDKTDEDGNSDTESGS